MEVNFPLDGSEECFRNIFLKYITVNSAKGIDNINYKSYAKFIEENSKVLARKVSDSSYKFSDLKEKLILKGRGKEPREIVIPTIRDKVLLKYIQLKLQGKFSDEIQKTPQYRISEFKYVAKERKFEYLLKLDIEKFFDNIDHKILIEKIKMQNMDEKIINLIRDILSKRALNDIEMIDSSKRSSLKSREKGVPQGISISNILAHIYLSDIDKKFSKINDIKYIRYVDDIIIFCDENKREVILNIFKEDIQTLGLSLNIEKKDEIKLDERANLNFLGYNYRNIYDKYLGFSVKKENLYKFENSLINIFVKFDKNKTITAKEFVFTLNNRITGAISKKISTDIEKEKRYGWLFFYSQIDDYGILHHLDKLIEKRVKMLERKIELEGLQVKKFVKAFEEIRKNLKNTEYIFRPDDLSIDEKRMLLIKTFRVHQDFIIDEKDVEKFFYSYVYKKIKDYENDINLGIS